MPDAKTNRTETYLGRLSSVTFHLRGKSYYLSASIRDYWPLVSRRRWPLSRVCAKLLVTLNSMLKHRSPWRGVTPAVVCHSA